MVVPAFRYPAQHGHDPGGGQPLGYQQCVSYDVDPQDYLDPGAAQVVTRTLGQVQPGSIVSLHLGHAGTVRALPQILAGLAAKGLAPVTLSRLLRD